MTYFRIIPSTNCTSSSLEPAKWSIYFRSSLKIIVPLVTLVFIFSRNASLWYEYDRLNFSLLLIYSSISRDFTVYNARQKFMPSVKRKSEENRNRSVMCSKIKENYLCSDRKTFVTDETWSNCDLLTRSVRWKFKSSRQTDCSLAAFLMLFIYLHTLKIHTPLLTSVSIPLVQTNNLTKTDDSTVDI